ncbi:MAG: IS630 family transposase [Chloroflexota bacterium]
MNDIKAVNWKEGRRIRAWELYQQGWKQSDIAEALGVANSSVSRWLKRAKAEGLSGLKRRPGGGPKKRLTDDQLAQLPGLLEQGAEAYGFRGDVWNRPRVAEAIYQTFGVRYTPTHVGRLLKQMGWTYQKPQQRAAQRDEAAIEQWRTAGVERLKKSES